MEAALTIVSVVIGLYAGWRMLGRSARAVWAAAVNAFEARRAEVTSSGREQQNDSGPSEHRQTRPAIQTDSPPTPAPAITREQMLDAAKVLRAAGLSREKGRAVFSALGLPLDNNLWAAAAPPEPEADYVTPIAGRATKKAYYPDEPELEFAPPTS